MRRTLPYSEVPPEEHSQPRLKHCSDIHTRVTPKAIPRITPVRQPKATFAYRRTEPDVGPVPEEQDAKEQARGPISEGPPFSASRRTTASANRRTEPDIGPVPEEQDADDPYDDSISDESPSSAHRKAAASKRPRDQKPLVHDTHYSFVAKRPFGGKGRK